MKIFYARVFDLTGSKAVIIPSKIVELEGLKKDDHVEISIKKVEQPPRTDNAVEGKSGAVVG